jgi:hypothetical protein
MGEAPPAESPPLLVVAPPPGVVAVVTPPDAPVLAVPPGLLDPPIAVAPPALVAPATGVCPPVAPVSPPATLLEFPPLPPETAGALEEEHPARSATTKTEPSQRRSSSLCKQLRSRREVRYRSMVTPLRPKPGYRLRLRATYIYVQAKPKASLSQ